MKDRLIYMLSFLILLQLGMEGVNLYRQRASRPEILRDAPPGTRIDVSNRPVQGSVGQEIILIEFSDFECPFCIRHASTVSTALHQRYVETGFIRHAFVNNPLEIHPNARLLAAAGICASEQRRFWEIRSAIFRQRSNSRRDVLDVAADLELHLPRFEECLDKPATEARIQADVNEARRLGLTGTPSFALGRQDTSGQVEIEIFVHGAQPLEVFEQMIMDML
jgi:protein-disulfide isomerase